MTDLRRKQDAKYLQGFGGHLCSEALEGALPIGQNNPQTCPYGLYSEQLSGTAFTCPRSSNKRTWMYRIRPSVLHEPFQLLREEGQIRANFNQSDSDSGVQVTPNQLRWGPMPLPPAGEKVHFIDGLRTLAGCGDAAQKEGLAIHMYAINESMDRMALYNSDGDFLLVPQLGGLLCRTELGLLEVLPGEVAVLPRGVKFAVELLPDGDADSNGGDGEGGGEVASHGARGYVLEVFKGHFELPELGPIGANGLASPRDILFPVAAYKHEAGSDVKAFTIVNKYMGRLFSTTRASTPFDVVAWDGNYAPFKYDLARFCTINSVSFDHPDPSIFTVLTVKSDEPGVAVADFVIFPPRWMVSEGTFRPPYFHRNVMAEFMGMIRGKYDAKEGFLPGGASLHSVMTAHGPDAATFKAASMADLKPVKFEGGLAFMFETTFMLKLTDYAMGAPHLERQYWECWKNLPVLFDPNDVGAGLGPAAQPLG